jgi:WD40 repeat protein
MMLLRALIVVLLQFGQSGLIDSQEASPIYAISLSKDETLLAVSALDGTVTVQDSATGEVISHLTGHTELATSVWSESRNQLATISTDLTARVWDIPSGEETHILRRADWVVGAVWLNDTQVYISDNSVTGVLWDLTTGETRDVPYGGWAFSFSPDRKYLAAARPSGIAVLDATTLEEMYVYFERYNGEASFLSIEDDEEVFLPVTVIAWQPNGKLIASGNTLGSIKLRDATSGEVVYEWTATDSELLTATDHFVKVLSFTPDGSQLYSVAEDGTIRIWDVSTGRLIEETHTNQMIRSATFTKALDQLFYIPYSLVEEDETIERVYDATGVSRIALKP